MSGQPNLSEYFANDAPSMFDEIVTGSSINGKLIKMIWVFPIL